MNDAGRAQAAYRTIGRALARAASKPCTCRTCLYTWPCRIVFVRPAKRRTTG
jgi:hypothetical protein